MDLYLGFTGSTVPANPPSIKFLISALPMVPAFLLAPTTATLRFKDAVQIGLAHRPPRFCKFKLSCTY
jgi:hypothetical protein